MKVQRGDSPVAFDPTAGCTKGNAASLRPAIDVPPACKGFLLALLVVGAVTPILYLQRHLPIEQTVSYLNNEVCMHFETEEFRIGRAIWVKDEAVNERLGCDTRACYCIYAEEMPVSRIVNYFHQDKPLCVQHVNYREMLQLGISEASITHIGDDGPTLWYTNDVSNLYHVTHFRLLPIYDFMVRHGIEAGGATFIDPKPRKQVPGEYGLYLLRLMGRQYWTEDFPSPSYVRFHDLWVRLHGRWLYPVHSFYERNLVAESVPYGRHLDVRWAQMSAFARRQVLSGIKATGGGHYGDDMVLVIERGKSRHMRDSETKTYDRVVEVLEAGGINVQAVRLEDMTVEEQLGLCMSAAVMVGVHGAALTNMMFMPPVDSTVIEIVFHPRLPDYYNMARAIGRSYKAFWADAVEHKIDPHPAAYEFVDVNTTALLQVIKDALSERGERSNFLCC